MSSYLETRFEGDMKQMLGKLSEVTELLTVLIGNRTAPISAETQDLREREETEIHLRHESPEPDLRLPPPKRIKEIKVIPKREPRDIGVEEESEEEQQLDEADGDEAAYSEYVVLEQEEDGHRHHEHQHSSVLSDLTLPFNSLESLTDFDRHVEDSQVTRNEFTRIIMRTLNNRCDIAKVVTLLLTDSLLEQIQKAETSLSDFYIFREYLHPTFFSEVYTSSVYLQKLADIGKFLGCLTVIHCMPLHFSFMADSHSRGYRLLNSVQYIL